MGFFSNLFGGGGEKPSKKTRAKRGTAGASRWGSGNEGITVKLHGDWSKLAKLNSSFFEHVLRKNIKRANVVNANYALKRIRDSVIGMAPSNAAFTRAKKNYGGTSNPSLVEYGKLAHSYVHQKKSDFWSRITIPEGERQDLSPSRFKQPLMRSVATWLHDGAKIPAGSDSRKGRRVRSFFLRMHLANPSVFKPLSKSKKWIIISPRPFFVRVMKDGLFKKRVQSAWWDAIGRSIRRVGGSGKMIMTGQTVVRV